MSGSMHSIIHCHIFTHDLHLFLELFFILIFSLIVLRELLASFYEDDRKSMSGGYFSVLVNSNLSIRTSLLFFAC
jgi:hypothetical protein